MDEKKKRQEFGDETSKKGLRWPRDGESGCVTKLDKKIIEKIRKAIEIGCYVETAAALAGVSRKSFYNWLRRGNDEPKSIFAELLHTVEKAMAFAEYSDIRNIKRHSKTNWQASAWRLERKFPDRWGRKLQARLEDDEKPSGSFNSENIQAEIAKAIDALEDDRWEE